MYVAITYHITVKRDYVDKPGFQIYRGHNLKKTDSIKRIITRDRLNPWSTGFYHVPVISENKTIFLNRRT